MFDSLISKRVNQKSSFVIVANLSNIARLQAQPADTDHRRRDLAAGELPVLNQLGLAVE
jgi:hypothetical protein